MVGVGSARSKLNPGLGRILPLAALWVVVGGCSEVKKPKQWGPWQYRESDVRTAAQQLRTQQALQSDNSSLSRFDRPQQRPMFSQTMNESQRRAFQKRHAKLMRERAEAQMRDAQERRRQASEAQKSFRAGGKPR